MGVFLICWAPFFTINVVGAFCPTCIPPLLFAISTWFGYVNSTMNPVIYSVFNRQFRDAFKRVLASVCSALCPKWSVGSSGQGNLNDYGQPMRFRETNKTVGEGGACRLEYGAVPSVQRLHAGRRSPILLQNENDEATTSV